MGTGMELTRVDAAWQDGWTDRRTHGRIVGLVQVVECTLIILSTSIRCRAAAQRRHHRFTVVYRPAPVLPMVRASRSVRATSLRRLLAAHSSCALSLIALCTHGHTHVYGLNQASTLPRPRRPHRGQIDWLLHTVEWAMGLV